MAETRFSGKDSKMKKFLSGKGFYIALAVCLVGAGAASWVAIDSSLKGLDEGQSIAVPQESSEVNEDWGFPELEETNEEQSDVEISSRSIHTGVNLLILVYAAAAVIRAVRALRTTGVIANTARGAVYAASLWGRDH